MIYISIGSILIPQYECVVAVSAFLEKDTV